MPSSCSMCATDHWPAGCATIRNISVLLTNRISGHLATLTVRNQTVWDRGSSLLYCTGPPRTKLSHKWDLHMYHNRLAVVCHRQNPQITKLFITKNVHDCSFSGLVEAQFLQLLSGLPNFNHFRLIPRNYKGLNRTIAGIPTGVTRAGAASARV